jgi:hypothetical protein
MRLSPKMQTCCWNGTTVEMRHDICEGCRHHTHPIGKYGYILRGTVECRLRTWDGIPTPGLDALKRERRGVQQPEVHRRCERWMEYVVLCQDGNN